MTKHGREVCLSSSQTGQSVRCMISPGLLVLLIASHIAQTLCPNDCMLPEVGLGWASSGIPFAHSTCMAFHQMEPPSMHCNACRFALSELSCLAVTKPPISVWRECVPTSLRVSAAGAEHHTPVHSP